MVKSVFDTGGLIGAERTYTISSSTSAGEAQFTTPGTFFWTAPDGVNNVSVICVGAGGSGATNRASDATGGGGGGGGALSYSNNVVLIPGETLSIVVGEGGAARSGATLNGIAGGNSSVSRGITVLLRAVGGSGGITGDGNFGAGGSAASGIGSVRFSGGNGGLGGSSESGGGGGAAGYAGNGGSGSDSDAGAGGGGAGTGGGGGAGGAGDSENPAGGGGGVGVFGQGANGAGGGGTTLGLGGRGGSSGANGANATASAGGAGGLYGGGGGGTSDDGGEISGAGANGAVRIIWGSNRAFPSTNTGNGQGGLIINSTSNSGIFSLNAIYDSLYVSPIAHTSNLLMHMDGTNGSTTFTDEINGLAVTVFGNAQVSTLQSKFGSGSLLLDGTGDYLSLPDTNSDFDFGTGDFTMEAWVRPAGFAVDGNSILSGTGPTNGDWMLAMVDNVSVDFGRNQVAWDAQAVVPTMSVNTWYHVAVSRSAGTLKIFLNGTEYFSAVNAQTYNLTNNLLIIGGRQLNAGAATVGSFFNGYIDEVRIRKGVGLYTSSFRPNNAPYA